MPLNRSSSINQFNLCTAEMCRVSISEDSYVYKVFEDLGMTKKEDKSKNKVIVMMQETMSPFDVNLDLGKIYNNDTGLTAMASTRNILLNVFKNWENERKKFIEEYSQDSRQFEKLIKRQKIILFAAVPCNVSGLCNLGPTTLRKPRDNILYIYILHIYVIYIFSIKPGDVHLGT